MHYKTYDAIIIGGGSNGMCLAAYLQRSGLQVAIFEKRHEEGGAVFTHECTAPGFLHNTHCNFMGGVQNEYNPFYNDFELEKFGARLIYPDAQAAVGFSDGRAPIILYSVAKEENFKLTHKSISRYSKHDADVFEELCRIGKKVTPMYMKSLFSHPPQPTAEVPDPVSLGHIGMMKMFGLPGHWAKGNAKMICDSLFESDELKTLLYKMTEEFGPQLEMYGMGAPGVNGFFKQLDWRISVGGSHSLAHAMAMACAHEGVHFFENCDVKKLIIKNGKAAGVILKDGTEVMATKLVASNAGLKKTLLEIVGEDNISPTWARRAKDFKVGANATLCSVALALHEAPNYKSAKHDPVMNRTFYTIVGYDCPEDVLRMKRDAVAELVPSIAAAGTWTNSIFDPTYAPPGKHALTGWFDFGPPEAFTPKEWEEIRATFNDKFIERFSKWAPNMTRDNVIDDFFYTLHDQVEEMDLADWHGGSLIPNQLGYMRPFPEASDFKTEIEGFYLCGPYMHPAGGVHQANAYNTYKRIAEDLGLDKPWETNARGY